jgi:hypothetical protein
MYRIGSQYNPLKNADPNPDQVFDQILVQKGQRNKRKIFFHVFKSFGYLFTGV